MLSSVAKNIIFGEEARKSLQTGVDKLHYNTKLAYEKGDKDYYILNVSNVREFTFELKAYSEMLWNFEEFSKDEYVDRYCEKFGSDSEEMKRNAPNPSITGEARRLASGFAVTPVWKPETENTASL